MLLIINVGNTRMSAALFDNDNLFQTSSFNIPKNTALETIETVFNSIYSQYNIDNCMASSVSEELNPILTRALIDVLNVSPIYVTSDLKLGYTIQSHQPQNIGTDRLANVCAAIHAFPQRPIIVVDSGTATTFDIIDKNDVFIGGVIMPGLDLQLNSLSEHTSKLPEVNLEMMQKVPKVINNDTKKAMLSGVVRGHACAIESLLKKCENELGEKPYVIGTGGNAELLNKYMKERKFDTINNNLTIMGIFKIFKLNED